VPRPRHRLRAGQGGQRLVPVPRRQQPRQVLAKPPALRNMREQVIETGPRTLPGDPGQAGTPSASSFPITGFRTCQEGPTTHATSINPDPTNYR
jgi:hypothetical protein